MESTEGAQNSGRASKLFLSDSPPAPAKVFSKRSNTKVFRHAHPSLGVWVQLEMGDFKTEKNKLFKSGVILISTKKKKSSYAFLDRYKTPYAKP